MFFRKKFLFFAKKKSPILSWNGLVLGVRKHAIVFWRHFQFLIHLLHMPSHELKTVKIFVLHYVHFTSLNQGNLLFFFMLLICFCSNWEPGFVSKLDFAIEISGICTALLLSQKEQRGRKIGGNRNKREPTSGKCHGLW